MQKVKKGQKTNKQQQNRRHKQTSENPTNKPPCFLPTRKGVHMRLVKDKKQQFWSPSVLGHQFCFFAFENKKSGENIAEK